MEQPSLPPSGIAGWLILPALVTFASAFYLSVVVYATVTFVITYNKEFDLIDGMFPILVAGWIVACVFLVKKKRSYPTLFVALSGVLFLYSLFVLYTVFEDYNRLLPEALDIWETAYFFNAILIPYMLLSKRVKRTFVN